MKVKCSCCGLVFERKKSCIKKNNYCSRSCLGKANGQRLKKVNLRVCDNCSKKYESNNKHKNRNKHFFCSKRCAGEYKSKKARVLCDWCGESIVKKRSDIVRNKHNFCDRGCYQDYINFELAGSENQMVGGKVLYRKLAESKFGRILTKDDEVHHIDGNHRNNHPDNLKVLSKQAHSKLHASKRERDCHGRFIKKRKSS